MAGATFAVNEIGQSTFPPVPIFIETFNTGVLDPNKWLTPNTNGGTLVNIIGASILGSGTVAGGYCLLATAKNPDGSAIFTPPSPGFLYSLAAINYEFPILTTAYRFWGFASYPLTPTSTVPLTEAVGFEVQTNGKLFAVTYQTGVRVVIADLSIQSGTKVQPQDGNPHKYFIFFRGDIIAWAIDDPANIVAEIVTGANGPNSNNLSWVNLAISTGGASATLQLNALIVGDWARTGSSNLDGTYPWRKQTVTAAGAALVQTLGGVSPGLLTPAGTSELLRGDGAGRLTDSNEDLLRQLIRVVRITNRLLLIGLNIDADIDANTDTDYD
jgi:hypothetical protein